jgi:2-hydroxy-3-oxopropionate reductase
MGAKGGLDPEVMVAAINAGTGHNAATEAVFPREVLNRRFNFGATMQILMKDIDLAIEQGDELGVPMWVCQMVKQVFRHAIFAGSPDDDLSSIVRYVEKGAGFELPKTR